MATKIGCKRTTPKVGLRRKISLKGKTAIRKISPKQKGRNKTLSKIAPPEDGKCEVCHQLPDWRGLGKHHIIFRSHNGSDNRDNLKWVYGRCHSKFHNIREK